MMYSVNDAAWLWKIPSDGLKLGKREVHVWRVWLERTPEEIEHFQGFLAQEEMDRAQRFYFEKDRRHWIVAHAALRILLGHYLDSDPRHLRFTTNEYGKPSMLFPLMEKQLHFNLSHSGNLALYAFSYNRQLGVDVEYMRSGIEYRELAAHHFSARECAVLSALPTHLQEEAFFLCWSRKEAYIKARGKGLSLPLDQFDVSLTPGQPAAFLGSREEPQAPERWSLHALVPGDHYVGALVVEGFDWELCCWQWQEI